MAAASQREFINPEDLAMIEVGMDRRQFLKTAGLGAAVLALPGLETFAADPPKKFCAPDKKMRIACVGGGGKGASDIDGVSSEEIVAICDVDRRNADQSFRKYPNAKQ